MQWPITGRKGIVTPSSRDRRWALPTRTFGSLMERVLRPLQVATSWGSRAAWTDMMERVLRLLQVATHDKILVASV